MNSRWLQQQDKEVQGDLTIHGCYYDIPVDDNEHVLMVMVVIVIVTLFIYIAFEENAVRRTSREVTARAHCNPSTEPFQLLRINLQYANRYIVEGIDIV